jgi:CarD family transcriptional regulator
MSKIGEQVFIPNYGAGVISSLEKGEIDKKTYDYVTIDFIINGMKFYIPIERLNLYNIRKISSKEMINKALIIIEEDAKEIDDNWNRRYRKNKLKILTGDILKTAEVIRDLQYIKKAELMPQGEEKILEEAEEMLASEIMLVYNLKLETAFELLKKSEQN